MCNLHTFMCVNVVEKTLVQGTALHLVQGSVHARAHRTGISCWNLLCSENTCRSARHFTAPNAHAVQDTHSTVMSWWMLHGCICQTQPQSKSNTHYHSAAWHAEPAQCTTVLAEQSVAATFITTMSGALNWIVRRKKSSPSTIQSTILNCNTVMCTLHGPIYLKKFLLEALSTT